MVKSFVDGAVLVAAISDIYQPIRTLETTVREDWTDFNGHMNEARYLDCFSNASDVLMQLIGCDHEYIAAGQSFFTVETHIVHMVEVLRGEPIFATTQILKAEGKKLQLFHRLFHAKEHPANHLELANCEQMLIHVDLKTRGASVPKKLVAQNMQKYGDAHVNLDYPVNAGRAIGRKQ